MRSFFLMVFLAQVLFSSIGHTDILSNKDRMGRDTGALYLYFVEEQNRLVKALCHAPRELPLNRVNCNRNRTEIGLQEFFDYYSPGFERIYSRLRHERDTLTRAEHFWRGLKPLVPANIPATFLGFLNGVGQSPSTQLARLRRTIQNLEQAGAGMLSFMDKLRDDYFVHDMTTGSALSAEMNYFAKRMPTAVNAAQMALGHRCKISDGRFETKYGGCTDNKNGLVWGKTEVGIDRFHDEGWIVRGGAVRHCLSSSLGNQFDWRVPSLPELETLVGYGAQAVGLEATNYYWTVDQAEFERSTYVDLGNRKGKVRVGNDPVLVGTRPGSNLDIVNGEAPEPVFEHFGRFEIRNTSVTAVFDYQVSEDKLIQLASGRIFSIKKHRLLGAKGTAVTSVTELVERPKYNLPNMNWDGGPLLVGTTEVVVGSRTETKDVNVQDFAYLYVPKDVERNKISLVCVRGVNHE